MSRGTPAVEFRHVDFSYGGDRVIDRHLPFGAQRGHGGHFWAALAPGNSTLMHLLMRFHRRRGGGRAGGRPGRGSNAPDALRHSRWGLVPQKAESCSPAPSRTTSAGATRRLTTTRRCETLPSWPKPMNLIRRQKDGYQSLVERGGTNLSGGQ
ncbi:MAG: hypothetical protein ACLU9S_09245 [Oscillospiraceae bacterium]